MRIPRAALVAVGAIAFATAAIAENNEDLRPIERMLRSGQTADAARELERILEDQPERGAAWLLLGTARHREGRYAAAAEANVAAAERSAMVRATAWYNAACAYALAGDADAASRSLDAALDSGFLDYDLIASDSDLDILREAGRLETPASHDYEVMTARNRVRIRYKIVLPHDYDSSRDYPALVSFAPGGWGPVSSDWALENVWGDESARRGWIAVHLVAPDDGWISHPAHHALEELLDDVKQEHRIEGGKFHLVGLREGSRPATTYGSMSSPYFHSVTTVGNWSFEQWDDEEIARYPQKSFHFLVGEADEHGILVANHAKGLMKSDDVRVVILEGEGVVPASTLEGGLMRYLDENVARPGRQRDEPPRSAPR